MAGANDDGEDSEESPEVNAIKGVRASDYDYFLSMAIGSFTLEKVPKSYVLKEIS